MIVAIVQARMDSARLPGKVLKPVLGKPLLWHLVNRLRHSKLIDKIVIATTIEPEDAPILELASEMDIDTFRGGTEDVLDRYYQAARYYEADAIVRITADCPLIDPQVTDKVIRCYLDNRGRFDYVSNMHPPTFPDGLDTEVIPFDTLERGWKEAKKPYEREHVTPYIWDNPEKFRIGNVQNDEELHLKERWTIDYEEDYLFIKQVYEHLYSNRRMFYIKDILGLLDREPEIRKINQQYLGMNWFADEWDNLKTKATLRTMQKQKR